ncbi:MAG: RdgB/HAM1 family non-canonical purine NTP pyrophosphatase [Proteobacteria bacterium]|nr:RdgB/HAM1 family non-canonical purine NTP pyrophosphatase [Pseudomonadota bacterium]
MRVVLASGNAGKLRELNALLTGLDLQLVSQVELGIPAVEETGTTFEGNALLKARHAAGAARLPAIADDSGIEVDALNGAPGLYSARYAGPDADDAANNAKLLRALQDVPEAARTARYRCVLAFVRYADDPYPLLAQGSWEGRIIDSPRGSGGFGYDPYFWLPQRGCTAAELEAGEKDHLSHRGQAMRRLRAALERL